MIQRNTKPSMLSSVTAALATLCYLGGAILQYLGLTRSINSRRSSVLVLGILAVLSHFISFYAELHAGAELDLGIFNMLSLISWLVAAVALVSCITKPLHNIFIGVYPFAAVSILLATSLSGDRVAIDETDIKIKIHILLSLFAYSVLTLAAAQAVLLAVQDHHLRHQLVNGVIMRLPPLQLMEQLLFELIWIGVLLLSGAIVTGVLFIQDIFAQQLAHKTMLSIIAWMMLAALLFGRHGLGWRGSMAIRMTLGGYSFLALAYFGTKFVLEVLLHR